MEDKVSILRAAAESGTVKEHGLFIIHIPTEERKLWEDSYRTFHLVDERKYGRSILLFYRRADVQDR